MNYQIDNHPAYSPGVNPVEIVWVELKKLLQELSKTWRYTSKQNQTKSSWAITASLRDYSGEIFRQVIDVYAWPGGGSNESEGLVYQILVTYFLFESFYL